MVKHFHVRTYKFCLKSFPLFYTTTNLFDVSCSQPTGWMDRIQNRTQQPCPLSISSLDIKAKSHATLARESPIFPSFIVIMTMVFSTNFVVVAVSHCTWSQLLSQFSVKLLAAIFLHTIHSSFTSSSKT